MTKQVIIPLVSAFAVCVAGWSADTISINEPRPLYALATELQKRCSCIVTYEEAPYDGAALRAELRANGMRFLYPSSIPMQFTMPTQAASKLGRDAAVSDAVPSGAAVTQLTPDVVQALVDQYNASGNPGRFTAIFEGQYIHIVPTSRALNNENVEFQPILSTPIIAAPGAHSCGDVLDDVMAQIKIARGTTIVYGRSPTGALLRHTCSIVGDNLTARQALAQVLLEAGTNGSVGEIRTRYAWALLYDANTEKYFLSTIIVPNQVLPENTEATGNKIKEAATKTPSPVVKAPSTSRTGDIKR